MFSRFGSHVKALLTTWLPGSSDQRATQAGQQQEHRSYRMPCRCYFSRSSCWIRARYANCYVAAVLSPGWSMQHAKVWQLLHMLLLPCCCSFAAPLLLLCVTHGRLQLQLCYVSSCPEMSLLQGPAQCGIQGEPATTYAATSALLVFQACTLP